jgi:hypothetical protein
MQKSGFFYILPISLFLLTLCSCKNETSTIDEPQDTRILVQQAYDSVNFLNVSPLFNHKKVAYLRQIIDQEPDPLKKMNLNVRYAQELLNSGKAKEVKWPCLDCPDSSYTGLGINKSYLLTEGDASVKELT